MAGKIPRSPRSDLLDAQIGARIRARRLARKLSQTDLGKALGVTFQQIQKYEKGVNRVAGSRLVRLCSVLQVRPEQLLGNGTGIYTDDPDLLQLLGDSNMTKMLVELHRLPKSKRMALLEVLRTIARVIQAPAGGKGI